MSEPSAQEIVGAGTNSVRNQEGDRFFRKLIHMCHFAWSLIDRNTRHDVASTGPFVEKPSHSSAPPHHGHADGTPSQRIVGKGGGLILRVLEGEQIGDAVVRDLGDLLQGIGQLGEPINAIIVELRAIAQGVDDLDARERVSGTII